MLTLSVCIQSIITYICMNVYIYIITLITLITLGDDQGSEPNHQGYSPADIKKLNELTVEEMIYIYA